MLVFGLVSFCMLAVAAAIDISFGNTSPNSFEAIWRASNGQFARSDVSGTSQNSLDNSVSIHFNDGASACDAILNDLNNPNPVSGQPIQPAPQPFNPGSVDRSAPGQQLRALCPWSCAMGKLDISMAYVPGTLYTRDLGGGRSATVWQEACLPGSSSSGSSDSSNQPKWASSHNCRGKQDGSPWKGTDAVDGGLPDTDMPAGQATFARDTAAQALNNFQTPKEWAQYVYKKMVEKYPRTTNQNGWWVLAGCGTEKYWSGGGLRDSKSEIIMWFGDARFAITRPHNGN